MVTLLLKVEILTIRGEDLRKIPTGHELNQLVNKCEGSLRRGKDEKIRYGENEMQLRN